MTEGNQKMPKWFTRAVALSLGGLAFLGAADWVLIRVRSLIIVILVSLFLSFAIEPAVNWLARRGWRRGLATLAMFLLILLGVGGFLFAMGSVLAEQITKLTNEACLLYTSPSPRDLSTSRMPSSA